jgi:hypothetical protein
MCCDRRYVFDTQPPPNSPNPLVFNPTGACAAFVVNPKMVRPALEKQRADEVEYAQLVEDNVSVAPTYTGLDGGMNKAFLAPSCPQYPAQMSKGFSRSLKVFFGNFFSPDAPTSLYPSPLGRRGCCIGSPVGGCRNCGLSKMPAARASMNEGHRRN